MISNLRMELEIEHGKVRQEQKRKQHMEANFSEQRVLNAQAVMVLTAQLHRQPSLLQQS